MLLLYAVALGLGGTFLAASLLLGGHSGDEGGDSLDAAHDADTGVDGSEAEASHDGSGESDHDSSSAGTAHSLVKAGGGADAALAWLPLTSLRFWTFFATFFGATGLVLSLTVSTAGALVDALVSAGVGYLSGLSVVVLGRKLKARSVDSGVTEDDYVGTFATVMLTIAPKRTGKVRFDLKGRTLELAAETEESLTFERGEQVMIYRVRPDGLALVTSTEPRRLPGSREPRRQPD